MIKMNAAQKSFFNQKYGKISDDTDLLSNILKTQLSIDYSKIGILFSRLKLEDSLVLDIGCGDQPQCYIFAPNSTCKITGLDFTKDGLRLAQERAKTINYRSSFTPVLGDALNLPFKDETFDAIISSMVLEHVDDPQQFIRESSRVLKAGGKLFIYTVNKNHIFRGIYGKLFPSHYDILCHPKDALFTLDQFRSWFGQNGLDLEEHLFAFSFETAIWDFYIVPWLIKYLLKNNPCGKIKLINAIKAFIIKLAILDRIFKKVGNSSCLVVVAKKVKVD